MQRTGEKPGVGTYTCVKCGNKVVLEHPNNRLPMCDSCDFTAYE